MSIDVSDIVFKIASALSGRSVKEAVSRPNGGEIYRIWFDNDPSGKCYVGQTIQGSLNRIRQHVEDARDADGDGCPLLDAATRRFGLQHMRYEVLEQGIQTHEDLDMAEKYWIAKFGSQEPGGYNVKSGGQRSGGFAPIGRKSSKKLTATNPLLASFIEGAVRKANVPPVVGAVIDKIL